MPAAGQYHTANITLNVNGQSHSLKVRHHWTLLDVVREQLDLIGSKKGCDRGECGSCTVLLDGKPVYACQMLAVQVGSRSVITIEGLGDGDPNPDGMDPVQRAFLEQDGGQCGFCTPDLSCPPALLTATPTPTDDEIRQPCPATLCRARVCVS